MAESPSKPNDPRPHASDETEAPSYHDDIDVEIPADDQRPGGVPRGLPQRPRRPPLPRRRYRED